MSEALAVSAGILRAVDLAREAARGYSNTQVDTEHLLLGLLQERKRRKNFVAWCFDEFDVTLRDVREQIESMWAPDVAAGARSGVPIHAALEKGRRAGVERGVAARG